ncbi:MAG: hypothetical protein H7249_06890 [Chitinophagaceae bacterium]|nr:hypothetical protein [Oligoflexus sp.]
MLIHKRQFGILFIVFNMLIMTSCGKKKTATAPAPTASMQIPADWDLKSDYSTADLKVKDLNP